ncbi:hypothetical protein DMUE_4921 [Dictyocoela muelleri]|nr:hypothetical protein DMUE_4921 [Dictyocoela muelleri]
MNFFLIPIYIYATNIIYNDLKHKQNNTQSERKSIKLPAKRLKTDNTILTLQNEIYPQTKIHKSIDKAPLDKHLNCEISNPIKQKLIIDKPIVNNKIEKNATIINKDTHQQNIMFNKKRIISSNKEQNANYRLNANDILNPNNRLNANDRLNDKNLVNSQQLPENANNQNIFVHLDLFNTPNYSNNLYLQQDTTISSLNKVQNQQFGSYKDFFDKSIPKKKVNNDSIDDKNSINNADFINKDADINDECLDLFMNMIERINKEYENSCYNSEMYHIYYDINKNALPMNSYQQSKMSKNYKKSVNYNKSSPATFKGNHFIIQNNNQSLKKIIDQNGDQNDDQDQNENQNDKNIHHVASKNYNNYSKNKINKPEIIFTLPEKNIIDNQNSLLIKKHEPFLQTLNLKFHFYKLNKNLNNKILQIYNYIRPESIISNKFVNSNLQNNDIKNIYSNYNNPFRVCKLGDYNLQKLIDEVERENGENVLKIAKDKFNEFIKGIPFLIKTKNIDRTLGNNNYYNRHSLYRGTIKVIHKDLKFPEDELSKDEKLIIYRVSRSIFRFLEKSSEDIYILNIFPEFKIIYDLYKSNMNKHFVFGKKWHSGYFVAWFLKEYLRLLKQKYQNIGYTSNNNSIVEFSKNILDLRIFYICNLLKFMGINRIHLSVYLILSIKYYYLRISGSLNQAYEMYEFDKMFKMSSYFLYGILYKQVFNRNIIAHDQFYV